MISGKRVIGIIPARGGSKGLPGKNLRSLCGKPLIGWTIEKANISMYLDVVLVTTDSLDISNVAREYGAQVPFLRPEHLADDLASTYDVVRHALDYYRNTKNQEFDYVVLLEPTSPLRADEDIDRMLTLLEEHEQKFDAIISVGEIAEHPAIVKRIDGLEISSFCKDLTETTRRQDNIPAYFPYGVAYITKTSVLLEENTFYPRRCMPFQIERYQNYEIDDIYDFLCVENIMKFEWGLN